MGKSAEHYNTVEGVFPTLIELVQKHVQDATVTEDSRFVEDLALDSVEVMDLVADLEDTFDVSIPMQILPELLTVRDTARKLVQLISER